ncbi:hypothetical protein HA402_003958 [Bradysia odoriphaga]|nr:hypothetical protein HA402_003958 [Bradysia odoriphaga]
MLIVIGAESSVGQELCDDSIEVQSPKCNYNGNYTCGVCECNELHFGKRCECGAYAFNSSEIGCGQSNTTLECSGRGNCICGICACEQRNERDEVIYGKYCECDNYSCVRREGRICADNGVCECGKCVCEPGWTNDDCSIPI